MRDFLTDVIRHFSGSFETIRVDADGTKTVFASSDADRTFFIQARAKDPIPELEGSYGITNLPLLKGLLDFAPYKQGALAARRRKMPSGEVAVEQFEFREANGTGADFRLMSAKLVQEQPEIKDPAWDVVVTPDKAIRDQFSSLAGLYAKVDGLFGTATSGGNLVVTLGSEEAATHRASMVYASDITASLRDNLLWDTNVFLGALKNCGPESQVKISNKGVLSVEASTDLAVYKYYIRTKVR